MTTENLNLRINAEDRTRGVLSSIQSKVMAIGGAYLGFQGASRLIGDIITVGMENEKVWTQVEGALKRQGHEVDDNLKKIKSFADELQTLTGISDEKIGTMTKRFIDYGASISEAQDIMRVAADFAAGSGFRLETAVDLLNKAQVGYTGTLARYGIIIDENIPKQEKFAEAIKIINQRFGGAAADIVDTTAVKYALMGEKVGDLEEHLFALFSPAMLSGFDGLIDVLDKTMGVLDFLWPPAEKASSKMEDLKKQIDTLKETGGSKDAIDNLTRSLEDLESAASAGLDSLIETTATSEAIARFDEIQKKFDEGFDIDPNAIKDLQLDLLALGSPAVRDATSVLIAGLNQVAVEYQGTGEIARLTEEEIAQMMYRTAEVEKETLDERAMWTQYYYDLRDSMDLDHWNILNARIDKSRNYWDKYWEDWKVLLMHGMTAVEKAETKSYSNREKAAQRFQQSVQSGSESMVMSMVDDLWEGEKSTKEIFSQMHKDFIKLFIKAGLSALMNSFVPGIGSILGSIFDTPKYDKLAMTQGIHYVQWMYRGMNEEFDRIEVGKQIASGAASTVPVTAPTGPNGPGATGSAPITVLQFTGPITNKDYVEAEIIPAIVDVVSTSGGRLGVVQPTLTGKFNSDFGGSL